MVEVLVTSSVMILGILCLRKLTMGKISMRIRYALWLLVAVRLLLPVSVGTSSVSVMNLLPASLRESYQTGARISNFEAEQTANGVGETERQENAGEEEGIPAEQKKENGAETTFFLQHPAQETGAQSSDITPASDEVQKISGSSAAADAKTGTADREGGFPVYVIWVVWLSGFLTVSGYMLFMRTRFVRYLRKNREQTDGEEIPVAIGKRLADRGIRVYQVKGLPSPCLVGRHIYIGDQMPEVKQELTHILAHEYCHAVHGDGFWALLRCVLVAVYWFDPFVWAAAFAARQDSDLACDEAAVRLLGEEERFAYGRTLLALLQESGGGAEC
ncbi:MAG: M56 family metallopeptidase, partial [Lachnospiraceae bacterium]|nr:M56 family metallopeptidase [Lachnospiraceae bacterium]